MRKAKPGLSLAVAALGLTLPQALHADEVQLVTTNGLFDFRGELLAFDGQSYTLRSSLGTLTFPADEVTCVGDACPQVNEVASSFRIAGGVVAQRGLVPELLDAYSLGVDTDISRGTTADGNVLYQLLSFEGESVVDVELVERDAAAAFGELAAGTATLVFSNRRATEDEAAALTGRDSAAVGRLGLERVLALDGIAVTIGAQAGVDSLSTEDLLGILSGEIGNWSTLGGPDLPISVFTREADSDIREMLTAVLTEPAGATLRPDLISVDSDEGLIAAVATFPNSIGFSDLAAVDPAQALPVRNACGVAIAPSAFAVKTGTYPLIAPVYVYEAAGDVSVHARGMVDFAQSPAGQEILSLAGFIDLRPAIDDGGQKLPGLLGQMEEVRRLSSTFRLSGDADASLGPQDRLELAHLAAYIRDGRAKGEELVFLGIGPEGADSARRMVDLLFETFPDTEEQLTVGFRVLGTADPSAVPCGAEDGHTVQVWARSLAKG
ncbi:PstS family phosphate ABC transporter substrate-binding protein [Halovulum sp. GXIMD14794]